MSSTLIVNKPKHDGNSPVISSIEEARTHSLQNSTIDKYCLAKLRGSLVLITRVQLRLSGPCCVHQGVRTVHHPDSAKKKKHNLSRAS